MRGYIYIERRFFFGHRFRTFIVTGVAFGMTKTAEAERGLDEGGGLVPLSWFSVAVL